VALRRDLHDLAPGAAGGPAGAAPPPTSSAAPPANRADAPTGWLAIKDLNLGSRTYQLVAVVNLTLFESLWARVDNEDATELLLMDLAGRRLVSHHAVPKDEQALRAALREAVGPAPAGRFDLGADDRFQVQYRVSPRHPVTMVVIGDRQALATAQSSTLRNFALAALLTSIAVMALLTRLYRIYQRYESTAVEMSNQAYAIGAHMLVSESSPEGTILSVNDNYCLTSGYEAAELVGQNHRIFNSGIHPTGYYRVLWETVLAGKVWKGTFRNRHKDGSHFWLMATIIPFTNAWGKVERFVAIYTDITESITLTREVSKERHRREQLAQVNQDLLSAVHTDPLTGVANRRGFDSFASHLPAVGGQGPLAVLMLDLDHFKSVNDTYGHAAGDEVLKATARRWIQQIRDSDLLARVGGEEFCILLPGADLEGARGVAEKIRLATCSTPVMVPDGSGRRPLQVSVSIGLAWAGPSSSATLQTLLDLADEAVYESKDSGRNRVSARVG
jgi:diguanylate cyclase (GGDEF)-like protein/PAS domain S-box-containing protein